MCRLSNKARYVRVDTMVEEAELNSIAETDRRSLHIVYYVNDGSISDFENIIKPILPALHKEYGNNLEWTFLTVHPDMGGGYPSERVHYVPRMSLDEFRAFLRKDEFDLGIAPLQESVFSEAKYINKFMEFSTAGLPCIYSDVPPYAGFIHDGETGILAQNTPEAWIEAFQRMTDQTFRKTCVENAQKQIRETFSPEVLFARMAKDFPELIEFEAPKTERVRGLKRARLRAKCLQAIDPFLRMRARWKIEGFGSVCRWTWQQYIRKK